MGISGRIEGLRNARSDEDEHGRSIVECRFCHRWFEAETWDEHEYYCSGRAEADQYEAEAYEREGCE